MLNESEREHIRRAYYLQKKGIRRIAQEEGYSCDIVERALTNAPRSAYHLSPPRPTPRLGPYHPRIAALVNDLQLAQRKLILSSFTAFGNDKMTLAFIDRLTHKGQVLEFVGDSYRYRHRLQQDDAAGA